MYYTIIPIIVFLIAFFATKWHQHSLQRNFDKYVHMQMTILLPKEQKDKRRIQASLILELIEHTEQIRGIYISKLKSLNKDMRIKYFNGLLFEVNISSKSNIPQLSVGIQLPPTIIKKSKNAKEYIYIGGKLHLDNERQIPFGKKLPIITIN